METRTKLALILLFLICLVAGAAYIHFSLPPPPPPPINGDDLPHMSPLGTRLVGYDTIIRGIES